MARKPEADASGSLLEVVRSTIQHRRTGFAPWWERVDQAHVAELNDLLTAWRAGELGPHMRPVARAVVAHIKAKGIADIGEQGVIAWLRHKA